MHVDKAAHTVVEQEVEYFDLHGAPRIIVVRLLLVAFRHGILVVSLHFEKADFGAWLETERVDVGLPLPLLVSDYYLCHAKTLKDVSLLLITGTIRGLVLIAGLAQRFTL